MIFVYAISIAIVAVAIFKYRDLPRELRVRKAFRKIFSNQQSNAPRLEISVVHRSISFYATFGSREDYELAEKNGLFDRFTNQIGLFYPEPLRSGDEVIPFDPAYAVHYTWIADPRYSINKGVS